MNLIVAIDQNWSIGFKNDLLFRIPQDQSFFREKTIGKVVVMGRKTLDSLPNKSPLKGRINIVLTRNINFHPENIITVHSLTEVLEELKKYNSKDIYVIGGECIYNLLLPYCDTAFVTKIFHSFDADTYFTNLDRMDTWSIVSESDVKTYSGLKYVFREYQNIGPTTNRI